MRMEVHVEQLPEVELLNGWRQGWYDGLVVIPVLGANENRLDNVHDAREL
jgi:hypothetical protein